MIRLFTLLNKKQKKRLSFEKTQEFKFFIKNRHVLSKMPKFWFLYEQEENEFAIMRANLIIRSYFNKINLEKEIKNISETLNKKDKFYNLHFYKALKEKIVDYPYFEEENNKKNYILFFSRPLNYIYINEPYKMLEYPYSILFNSFSDSLIDPFDTYGANIYDSLFSRLVKVSSNGKEVAYFYYDLNTIYIVNDEGRLDSKIVLFDKYMKKINNSHMLERIKPVINAYFNNSRHDMILALHENKLISSKIYFLLKEDEDNYNAFI